MIGSLRGTVLEIGGVAVLVEVGGVGYKVQLASSDLARVTVGEPGFFYIHTLVREDALMLYGFTSRDALYAFEALLSAHGVGPSLALSILSVHSVSSLKAAVAMGDVTALTAVPGVGPKTAARLMLELENRFESISAEGTGALTGVEHRRSDQADQSNPVQEVMAALAGLGYGPEEVRFAVRGLPPGGELEPMLRSALKELASVR